MLLCRMSYVYKGSKCDSVYQYCTIFIFYYLFFPHFLSVFVSQGSAMAARPLAAASRVSHPLISAVPQLQARHRPRDRETPSRHPKTTAPFQRQKWSTHLVQALVYKNTYYIQLSQLFIENVVEKCWKITTVGTLFGSNLTLIFCSIVEQTSYRLKVSVQCYIVEVRYKYRIKSRILTWCYFLNIAECYLLYMHLI